MIDFKSYVASLYPLDTAVVEDYSEHSLIEMYDDLYTEFLKTSGRISEFDLFCAQTDIEDWCDRDGLRSIWDFQQAKIDELQARVDSLTNINESLVAYKNQLLDEIEEKGNKDGSV